MPQRSKRTCVTRAATSARACVAKNQADAAAPLASGMHPGVARRRANNNYPGSPLLPGAEKARRVYSCFEELAADTVCPENPAHGCDQGCPLLSFWRRDRVVLTASGYFAGVGQRVSAQAAQQAFENNLPVVCRCKREGRALGVVQRHTSDFDRGVSIAHNRPGNKAARRG